MPSVDAIVVGAGPNGLAAAVTLARAGLAVRVYEAQSTVGGGARTAELTLPGFRHDLCSAVHPMALASPFFRAFELERRVELRLPPASFGHPLDGGVAGIAYRDLDRTAAELGRDGRAYARLLRPLARHADEVAEVTGSSLVRVPRHPLVAARLGFSVLEQGTALWNARFDEAAAPAMLTGVAAHTIRPLPSLSTAGAGLVLTAHAHARGWPIPVGGSQSIVDALVADLEAHGGEVLTDVAVDDLRALPSARAVLLDVTPRALARIAGDRVPPRYLRALRRFRYGSAAAKVDFALSAPVPWANPGLALAGTVHVGGTRAEMAEAEAAVHRGRHASAPYVLVSQPSIVDPGRAPEGNSVLWAYTHVPAGSTLDPTEVVTRQIERFAPGFRDVVLATSSMNAVQVQAHNANYIGGDIAAGAPSLGQLLRRPVLSPDPWRTPIAGVYLASSSTPPGPGVHGLAGWHAALSALRHEFGVHVAPALAPGH
jgi:phytoene dehydrogenase-like protein